MKVYVKVHKACNDILVAICDEDVLGKEFKEGKLRLVVNDSFYKGKLIDIEELEAFIKAASILNIVGKASIEKAIECECIDKENVMKIGDTLHAQMVSM